MVEKKSRDQFSGQGNPAHIKVLMYHRIVPDGASGGSQQIWIPESQFYQHIEFLDRWGFTSITFDDYHLFLEGKLDLPRNPVIITFDDGYEETYSVAFPVLQKFGMKAVVFVVAERAVTESVWDNERPDSVSRLLSHEQIVELFEYGFEIGSHTLHHVRLTHSTREEAWEEISRSRMKLEILLNTTVRTFAYPYGLVSEPVKKMVRDAGYVFACSGWTGPAAFGDDPYEIRRILIPRGSFFGILSFGVKLLAPYQLYRWIVWQIKKIVESPDQ